MPSGCLLCNVHDESRQHLFFDCVYAAEVWSYFTNKAQVNPPICFEDAVVWLKTSFVDQNISLILKLAFQASLYLVWKERNSRLHTAASKPHTTLILEAKSLIRCHLDPLTRAQAVVPPRISLLASWFGVFQ